MGRTRFHRINLAVLRQRDRLTISPVITLFCCAIPFMGALVLSLYTSLETNTRLHANGKPLSLAAEPTSDHALWLSVTARDGYVKIATSGSESFSWPSANPKDGEFEDFSNYLKTRAQELVTSSIRTGQFHKDTHMAALAMDESLTFYHMRPILYALAGAGFSRYGIETRLIQP